MTPRPAPSTASPGSHQIPVEDLVRLRRVRDRIDREYREPLDVEALARGEAMSAGHLSRLFKRAYGESPYSYLMTRRIERAMSLLRRGRLSVTEVCFEVGSSSLGTFSTRFSELVGMPPSEYRDRASRDPDGLPTCVVRHATRPLRKPPGDPAENPVDHPVRNQEAPVSGGVLR
ncbi:helix-turn-helix transcriptional regulator [Citricoccus parietis]|uniref:Helix-turn-helix transcriptional regulator n=1 Tax=Citricoccus parietis TaxID=592307 RepID=A0ABV6F4N1_9MICC